MATVIRLRNPRAQQEQLIAETTARGILSGFDAQREKQASEERSRRLRLLLDAVQRAPSKREALSLAEDPKFEGLFEDISQLRTFGNVVSQIHDDREQIQQVDITANGQHRTAFLTDRQVSALAQGKQPNRVIPGFDPTDEVQIGHIDTEVERIPIVDVETGKTIRFAEKQGFNPQDLGDNEVTPEGFARRVKSEDLRIKRSAELRKKAEARRKALQESQGDVPNPSDAERAARGMLRSRGLEVTPENLDKALFITREGNNFARRIGGAFGLQVRDGEIISRQSADGTEQRFTIANAALRDLIFAGLTPSAAFRAAVDIGNGIETVGRQPGAAQQTTFPPIKQIPSVLKADARVLTQRESIGRVFRSVASNGERGFGVLVGIRNGQPVLEFIRE